MPTLSSVPEELKKHIAEKIRGLKLEYYDLLHKHGYADFKLDIADESEGYAEDEKWLEDIYITAFEYIINQQIKSVLDELEQSSGNPIALVGSEKYKGGVVPLSTIQKIRSRYE